MDREITTRPWPRARTRTIHGLIEPTSARPLRTLVRSTGEVVWHRPVSCGLEPDGFLVARTVCGMELREAAGVQQLDFSPQLCGRCWPATYQARGARFALGHMIEKRSVTWEKRGLSRRTDGTVTALLPIDITFLEVAVGVRTTYSGQVTLDDLRSFSGTEDPHGDITPFMGTIELTRVDVETYGDPSILRERLGVASAKSSWRMAFRLLASSWTDDGPPSEAMRRHLGLLRSAESAEAREARILTRVVEIVEAHKGEPGVSLMIERDPQILEAANRLDPYAKGYGRQLIHRAVKAGRLEPGKRRGPGRPKS